MSLQSAKSYLERIRTDVDFRKRMEQLEPAARANAVRDAGFDFSVSEITEALAEVGVDFEAPGEALASCIIGCIVVPDPPDPDPVCVAD